MKDKHNRHGMKLPRRPRTPRPQWNILQRPPIPHPVRHHGVFNKNGSWNRCALEVLALARGILGQHGDGNVKARKAREAAQDEEGEEDVVGGGAEAKGEGGAGGCNAKGNLYTPC